MLKNWQRVLPKGFSSKGRPNLGPLPRAIKKSQVNVIRYTSQQRRLRNVQTKASSA